MDEVMGRSTARQSFKMLLLTIFGAVALMLAAIGIYGLMAYSVAQRTQEMGIRMALGADRATIRKLVVWHGMRLALIGVMLGLAASFGLTRFVVQVPLRRQALGSRGFRLGANHSLRGGARRRVAARHARLQESIPCRRCARSDSKTAGHDSSIPRFVPKANPDQWPGLTAAARFAKHTAAPRTISAAIGH